MKQFKLFFAILTLGAIYNPLANASAGSTSSLEDSQKYISKPGEMHHIKGYKTSLSCTFSQDWTKKDFLCIEYNILDDAKQLIGEILIQYYDKYSQYNPPSPVIRLRDITITQESDRHKGHGGQALETLFTHFRKSPLFPKETAVILEYDALTKQYLKGFYEKFGFKTKSYIGEWDVGTMTVPLGQIKFPYFAKSKK